MYLGALLVALLRDESIRETDRVKLAKSILNIPLIMEFTQVVKGTKVKNEELKE